jgi:hypothetical protein
VSEELAYEFSALIVAEAGSNVLVGISLKYQAVPGVILVAEIWNEIGVINGTAGHEPWGSAGPTAEQTDDVAAVGICGIQDPKLKTTVNAGGWGLDECIESNLVPEACVGENCVKGPANAMKSR